jgi:hypothetical protein
LAAAYEATSKNNLVNRIIMKHIILLAFLLTIHPIIFSQTNNETQKIAEEILSITDKYNKTWETLNMENVAQFHSDSSFRYYRNMKLAVSSNDEFKKLMPLYMKTTKSWKIEVSDAVVQVLDKNAAVIGFTGKAEMITTDNKVSDFGSGAYTYVWKKTDGQWKIIHIHESAK